MKGIKILPKKKKRKKKKQKYGLEQFLRSKKQRTAEYTRIL